MARGLSSSVKTELATGNIAPVHLIDLNFSTPQYLTDCSFNLTSSISGTSRTYAASGHILNIGTAQEGSKPIKNSFNQNPKRVWVHTCSLDHKNALKNYISRGMKIFKTETISI